MWGTSSEAKSGNSARAYRPEIDGVRVLAISLVIGYHCFGLPGGYVGVAVFFMISGYLITGLLLAESDGHCSFGTTLAISMLPRSRSHCDTFSHWALKSSST